MRTVSSTFGWATKFMASTRELTISSFRHAEVRILCGQPASPISGGLFPGGGESPTFPQVRLGCPSLWSAISGISALAGRVSGSGLWWRFSNFRFGMVETGSIISWRPVLMASVGQARRRETAGGDGAGAVGPHHGSLDTRLNLAA